MSAPDVYQFGARVADPFAVAERILCAFSCGAASAAATKLAIDHNAGRLPVEIVYFDTGSEHEDNPRFLADCERWFGHPIVTMKNPRYADTWAVFRKERYLSGVRGAKCTTVLKKQMREAIERPTDLQVFGFDATEGGRATRFRMNQPEVMGWFPLIDGGVSKAECFAMLRAAGIALPAMYLLGYRNNNCIGCVKGGAGYWNKIRGDFPDVFARMAAMERELGATLLKTTTGGETRRVYLDELEPGVGRYESEPSLSCGVVCQQPDEQQQELPL